MHRDNPAAGGHHRVTYVELFFDLVFVFAVTQISHTLLKHFTYVGVLQVAILFFAVWWAWIFTSWTTNWLDPDRTPVRIALFALMLAGLVLSTSIPKAFDDRGVVFGVGFASLQVGRTLFMLWTIPSSASGLRRNFVRVLIWLSASGALWVAGGFADPAQRLWLWGAAVAIEYVAPATLFRVPGLGKSLISEWTVEGGHMAERCALFIIIALGESILVTGATFAEMGWTSATVSGMAVSFVASLVMWWIYFHKGAEAGAHSIIHAVDPSRMARLAYTYLHLPIVAGIILVAVGDELVMAHPDGHSDLRTVVGQVGGTMLFLIGVTLFKRTINGGLQRSHLAGVGGLMLLAPFAHLLSPLMLSVATTAILIVVAAWESAALGELAAAPPHTARKA